MLRDYSARPLHSSPASSMCLLWNAPSAADHAVTFWRKVLIGETYDVRCEQRCYSPTGRGSTKNKTVQLCQ